MKDIKPPIVGSIPAPLVWNSVANMELLQLWDRQLLVWINTACAHPGLDELARWLTPLGTSPFIVLYVGMWIAVARPSGYYYLLAALFNFLEVRLLKFLSGRPRPFFTLDVRLPLSVDQLRDGSFPSGHALTTFTLAILLGHHFPKTRWPALLLAALVSGSRVYTGVHYPSDVICGAVLGWLTASGIIRIARQFGHEKELPPTRQVMQNR